MRVNFMIIGAMKAGTSTLFEILKSHPDIVCSNIKETHFFSRLINWKENLQDYHKFFKKCEGKFYCEASPSYATMPSRSDTHVKIHAYNPEMKIIYIIRNPFDRCISHYMHMVERGRTELPIEEAFKQFPQIIETSRYYYQIKPYIDLFGKDQVLILDFDEFIGEKQKVIQELSDFLNIKYSRFPPFENVHANRSLNSYKLHPRYDKAFRLVSPFVKKWPDWLRLSIKKILSNPKRVFKEKPVLPSYLREQIKNVMMPEIAELEKITKKDFTKWLN